jgi:uncharacterized membrane protein
MLGGGRLLPDSGCHWRYQRNAVTCRQGTSTDHRAVIIAENAMRIIRRWLHSLSGIGIVLGTLSFAAALTPTLVPRTALTQGALAGGCFAIGYGCDVFGRWLWHYFDLPEFRGRIRTFANALLAAASAVIVLTFLWHAPEWQNSIRAVMGMAPVESARPFKICAVALVTFVTLLTLARLFGLVTRFLATRIQRYIPRKIATAIGVALAALLFWSVANDLLLSTALRLADSSFREFDALIEPDRPQPAAPGKTGSTASLLKWQELGRAGREFIASGPTAAEIAAFTGRKAMEPIRVYVGLRGAGTAQARAKLALEELKRQGGFDRSILVVVTPTGTGWVDPSAITPLEYLHNGDVASVAAQYSYLSSPLSLLVQPEYGQESARALFREVYAYWTALPKAKRPRLYLHGLSLGAMNSEKSLELFETIGDPIDGALWSGPPFESRAWRSITASRNAGSPAWLPEFRDSRFVRFMNQNGPTVPPDTPWGPMRVVYLQYASDAIVFFSYADLYRRPDWTAAPLGPDVSPKLRWYPVVTMLQLAVDMTVATKTPMGYGHVYAPEHYVDAWAAVTDVRNWPREELAKLKRHLGDAARRSNDDAPDDNRGG